MLVRDVSDYLTRFDAPPPSLHVAESPFELSEAAPPLAEDVACFDAPRVDEAAIRAHMQQLCDAQIAAAREETQAQLAAQRLEFDARAEALGARLTAAMETAVGQLRDDIAQILTPFVSQTLCAQMLDELTACARAALADEPDAQIKISGPQEFIDIVHTALGRQGLRVEAMQSEGLDAEVAFGRTTIRTKMAEWLAQLSKGDHP